MLTDEFKQQRARVLRDLAEKAIDPFIKNRLLLGRTIRREPPAYARSDDAAGPAGR